MQRTVVGFSLWTSLTLVLILFAVWYVKKHEPVWSYVVGSAPIVGCLITLWFWLRYERGNLQKSILRKIFGFAGLAFVIAFELLLFVLLIPWAREGGENRWIRPLLTVDLSSQKLITEPEPDYKGLDWVNLYGVHLEGANLSAAVLKRADLKHANLHHAMMVATILEGADLFMANLKGATLWDANLDGAILWDANLQHASLTGASLKGAILNESHLQWANLEEANLQGAYLVGANLQKATLGRANLQGAYLRRANLQGTRKLTIEQLSKVETLYEAALDPELMVQIKKDYPHLLEKPKEE